MRRYLGHELIKQPFWNDDHDIVFACSICDIRLILSEILFFIKKSQYQI